MAIIKKTNAGKDGVGKQLLFIADGTET
jgi:hypothetical protein